jgi:hypothetical protein
VALVEAVLVLLQEMLLQVLMVLQLLVVLV